MIAFRKIIDRVEKYLIRTILMSLLVIVVVQGIMTHDPLRLYLSWSERMEGQVVEYPVAGDAAGNAGNKQQTDVLKARSPQTGIIITVEDFSSLPRTVVLVNGSEKARFQNKEVKLLLQAGDVLEIDSRAYSFPVKYKIKNTSANLSFPEGGTVYTANQGIVMIGKIIVK
ncbi:hypothetical protein [Syntrophomonas curvata]